MTDVAPRSDGRRDRSLRTRARIVDAGARLFVGRGYVGTTIEAVAEAAGVAPQTVYYVFGTKAELLRAVLGASVVGDLEPVAVADRPWVAALAEAGNAVAALDVLVDGSVAILERVAPIYAVLRAAAADPEVGVLLAETRRRRGTDQRRLVEVLAAAGHLRDGLDPGTAGDVLYGLVNEDVFLLLTADCGWDVGRFRDWLAGVLRDQLLARS